MPAIDAVLSFLGHATQAGTDLATGYGKGKAQREEELRQMQAGEREAEQKRALLALQRTQEENRERERQRTAQRQEERDNARDARDRLTLELHMRRLKLAEDGAAERGSRGGSGRRRDGEGDGGVTAGQTRAYNLYSKIAENYVRAAGGDVNAALAEIHKNPQHRAARVSGQISPEMLRAAAAALAQGRERREGVKKSQPGSRFGGSAAVRSTPAQTIPGTVPARETISTAEADALRARGRTDAEIRQHFTVR